MRSMANKANKNIMTKTEKSDSKGGKSPYPESINSQVHQILSLQQTIGNLALQRLFDSGQIQAKMKIGKPNDIYEQEADRVADTVSRSFQTLLR